MTRPLLLPLLLVAPAHAFTILTPASEPCHEDIALSAFQSDALAPVVDALAARISAPTDRATRAFVDDVAKLYAIEERDPRRRFVLASIVIGVRAPDTRGFAVIKLNETRTVHIDDDNQADHSLRRSGHDGGEGNAAAITDAREGLMEKVRAARASEEVASARWSFPFYGEVDVDVDAKAFYWAQMTHTIQDAYTHMLRDGDLRVVTVCNFVDAVTGKLKEGRDGLPHSDTLDTCDEDDPLDAPRVRAARQASIDVVLAAFADDDTALGAVLDRVYDLRDGCTVDNDYCDSPYLERAREGLSEPVRLWFCSARPGATPAAGWWWLLLLARRRTRA